MTLFNKSKELLSSIIDPSDHACGCIHRIENQPKIWATDRFVIAVATVNNAEELDKYPMSDTYKKIKHLYPIPENVTWRTIEKSKWEFMMIDNRLWKEEPVIGWNACDRCNQTGVVRWITEDEKYKEDGECPECNGNGGAAKTTDKVKILPNPDFCVEIVPGKKVISKVAINIGKILLQLESDPEVAENPHNERQILIRCENIEMVCMIAIADPGFADYLKL